MKTNEQLQQEIEDALRFEPMLGAANIGVTVHDGIVTLLGTVDNYTKKVEAENAAKNVEGVKAVVEKIEVVMKDSLLHSDEDIAAGVLKALKSAWSVPEAQVKVTIHHGWVYLDGELSWDYQREAAKDATGSVPGVKGVVNNIRIKSDARDIVEEQLIKEAFQRHWSLKKADIKVEAVGTHVTLTGTVDSLYQKEEADRVAWKTQGVWSLDNKLVVEPHYFLHE